MTAHGYTAVVAATEERGRKLAEDLGIDDVAWFIAADCDPATVEGRRIGLALIDNAAQVPDDLLSVITGCARILGGKIRYIAVSTHPYERDAHFSNAPGRFRKVPVEIDAMPWDGTAEGATPIIDWVHANGGTARYVCADPERCAKYDGDCPHYIHIQTLEGVMAARIGDWIIRGVEGEFYPCKPDIFAKTYRAVL